MNTEETGAFRYCGKVLCEECAMAEREDICDGSGEPKMFWENSPDESVWPQRSSAPVGTECAECHATLT